jgi:D-alanyl-D-alanine carboxypeptidase
MLLAVLLASLAVVLYLNHPTATAPSPAHSNNTKAKQQTPVTLSFNTTDAASLQVIVNKQHPLKPIDYAPSSLTSVGNGQQMRTEAARAFLTMQTAAAADNEAITATSGYRSYSYQTSVYNNYVASYGVAKTDTFSARPGYSEHQTGLAIDIQGGGCTLDNCFANTAQGKWLAENAYKYGFLLRYPADKIDVTGYTHEAWHFRYIGTELASTMRSKGMTTLEEYFNITGGSDY